jgi:hypothetical protein
MNWIVSLYQSSIGKKWKSRADRHHPRGFYVIGEYTRLPKRASPGASVDCEIWRVRFAGLVFLFIELIERAISMDNLRRIYNGTRAGINEEHVLFSRMDDNLARAPASRTVSHEKRTTYRTRHHQVSRTIASSEIVKGYARDGRVREATSCRRN